MSQNQIWKQFFSNFKHEKTQKRKIKHLLGKT